MRTDPQSREIPIILLSARAGEESIMEALEAGADDYLIKPFSAQELLSRMNAHPDQALFCSGIIVSHECSSSHGATAL